MKKQSNNSKILPLFLLGVVAVVIWIFNFQLDGVYAQDRVVFFDVGQGDSALIINSYNQKILIDGGPDSSILSKLGGVLPFYDRYIDLVLLTHPHSDHLVGLIDVLERYKIGAVILTGVNFESEMYKLFLEKIEKENIKKIIIDSPKLVKLGADGGIFKILYPLSDLRQEKFNDDSGGFGLKSQDLNNTSIVGKFSNSINSFIFMADVGMAVESKLIDIYGADLDSQILKVGHHGSKNSSYLSFLNLVKPEYSVISVGTKNKYGHPNNEVVERLKNYGKVYRTDLNGDTGFEIKDKKLYIKIDK